MSDFLTDLSGISPTGNKTSVKTSSKDPLSLDMNDFLQLMVAQFQNQDPENAASTSDMLNQMVQMSTIQALSNITDATTMLYTSSLVGKTVTVGQYDAKGALQEISGTVTGTGTYNDTPVVFVDGVSYNVSSIMAVGSLPSTDSTDTPGAPDTPGTPGTPDTPGTPGTTK